MRGPVLRGTLLLQLKQNFLNVFIYDRGNNRDPEYARYNFAFVIAEFLGWLEVSGWLQGWADARC